MLTDTKGLLPGHVTAEEIADALSEGYGARVREIQACGVSYLPGCKFVHFDDPSGGTRILDVFEAGSAPEDIAEDEDTDATLVALSAAGHAREAIRFLAERFGGTYLPGGVSAPAMRYEPVAASLGW